MSDLSHLDSAAIELLEKPISERVEAINQEIFVPYQFANKLITALKWRMSLPRGSRRASIALGGGSGLGKTHLITELLRLHGIDRATGLDANGERPILLMECTSLRTAALFRARLARTVGCAPANDIDDACLLIRKSAVRLIIFDEAHTLRGMKPLGDFVTVCDYIKQISNSCERPLLLAGDLNVADMLVSDEHLATRFISWKLEPWKDVASLRGFVDSILSTFPLPDPSPLTDDTTLALVIEQTRGNTESIVLSLRRTAVNVVESGGRRITRADWLETLRGPY